MRSSDLAYEQIKEMILKADLKPGEVIVDSELMNQLNMGRTPIREALNRLSWERHIRIIPRQCIMVSQLSNKDVESIYQVRYALTSLEGELASERRTEKDLTNLAEIIARTEKEQDGEKRVFLDREFHMAISKMTGNDVLINEMTITLDQCTRLLFLNREHISSIDNSVIHEYKEIYESIKNKDSKRTIELLQQHLNSFRDKFI